MVKPRIWKRYVDDTLCIVRKGEVDKLLDHQNSVRPSIQFIVEVEKDGSLPFLDTLIKRKSDGSLDITMYRKTTHTDRYLHFNSHHSPHVKRGLIKCLSNRASSIVKDSTQLTKEHTHLSKVLRLNGYPKAFIDSTISTHTHTRDRQTDDRQPVGTVSIPYISGISEDIRRICRRFNIRVAFRSGTSLRSMLSKVKDPSNYNRGWCTGYLAPAAGNETQGASR